MEYNREMPLGCALLPAELLATHKSSEGAHREPFASRTDAHGSRGNATWLSLRSKGLEPSTSLPVSLAIPLSLLLLQPRAQLVERELALSNSLSEQQSRSPRLHPVRPKPQDAPHTSLAPRASL